MKTETPTPPATECLNTEQFTGHPCPICAKTGGTQDPWEINK